MAINYHPHANHHLAVVLLAFVLLMITSSASRPLNDFSSNLAATEPTFNLALPTDGVVMPEEEKIKEEPAAAGHVSSPCDHHMMRLAGSSTSGGRKYKGTGALILNMLPKGKIPPSGPSKGTNDLNN